MSIRLPDICEYCGRKDVIIYAWRADEWCGDCIEGDYREPNIPLEDAPLGRPLVAKYNTPFVWQTPDGSVVRGVLT